MPRTYPRVPHRHRPALRHRRFQTVVLLDAVVAVLDEGHLTWQRSLF